MFSNPVIKKFRQLLPENDSNLPHSRTKSHFPSFSAHLHLSRHFSYQHLAPAFLWLRHRSAKQLGCRILFFFFFFSQATKHNKISLYEHCSLRCGIPISKRTNNVKNVLIPPALCFHSISRYGLRDAPVFASGGEIAYCAGAGGNRPFIYNWYELNSWGCCSGDINRTHGRCRPTRRGACELPRQSQPVKGYLNDGSSISQRHLFSHWKVNCRPLLNSSEG